ncbi:MAG: response regulator transcription factor [Bacteroidales bacterium]|nr:response regulator transcription factor [Bacteroidales bacterium]
MENNIKILIVDDDLIFIEFLDYILSKEGYIVIQANSGDEAIEIARRSNPHLILLDIKMPKKDGIEVCIALRNIPEISHTKIAFVSGLLDDKSKIAGFEAGADDYICKPIKPKVLLARIGALLKAFKHPIIYNDEKDTLKKFGNITIDFEKYLVIVDRNEIELPKKEFQLLKLLSSKPSKVFTRQEILDQIWENSINQGSRYIDVHIHNLREKLGSNHIKTIKGVGYKFS